MRILINKAISYVLLVYGTMVISSTVRIMAMGFLIKPELLMLLTAGLIMAIIGYKLAIKGAKEKDLVKLRLELVLIILLSNLIYAVMTFLPPDSIIMMDIIAFVQILISLIGIVLVIKKGNRYLG
jgi:hypothetical protein